jgi:hypothetical protein
MKYSIPGMTMFTVREARIRVPSSSEKRKCFCGSYIEKNINTMIQTAGKRR